MPSMQGNFKSNNARCPNPDLLCRHRLLAIGHDGSVLNKPRG